MLWVLKPLPFFKIKSNFFQKKKKKKKITDPKLLNGSVYWYKKLFIERILKKKYPSISQYYLFMYFDQIIACLKSKRLLLKTL